MTRRREASPRKIDTFTIGGLTITVPAVGYCDCRSPYRGFTKREDGCWVRPCCMRRDRQVFEKWGDQPIPPTHITEREAS